MCSRFVTIYTQDGHNIYDKNSNEIINTPKNSVIIGDNVLTIGEESFKECKELNNIIIGKRVEIIEKGAFNSCIKFPNAIC